MKCQVEATRPCDMFCGRHKAVSALTLYPSESIKQFVSDRLSLLSDVQCKCTVLGTALSLNNREVSHMHTGCNIWKFANTHIRQLGYSNATVRIC